MADGTKIEWTDAKPDPLVLAYLAGVIDSDGYITINRSSRAGRLYHGAVVGIAGTRREPHDLAASLWGGKVSRYVPPNARHRPQFQWSRQGEAAAVIIARIAPYLRVKRANVDLALELQEHVACGRDDDAFPWFLPDYDPIAARERMRAEMVKELNIRRRSPAEVRS